MITIGKILRYQSFDKATLITGEQALDQEVTSVMVMEAPDIDVWGKRNSLILTSYYAMEHVSNEKIDLFFRHAKRIGISGFVVKVDRLVPIIPAVFVEACTKYTIPLIKIDKDTSYERIMSEVLENIINRNAFVLQNFYEVHKEFSRLLLRQPKIEEILLTLERLLGKPVSLYESIHETIIGTQPNLNEYTTLSRSRLPQKQYMNYPYFQSVVHYHHSDPAVTFTQLSIPIPHLGYEQYELIIHEMERETEDVGYMTIENAVAALQIELVKRYAIKQNNRSRLNEMASDLLHGRLTNEEDIKETMEQLTLDPSRSYRVVLVAIEPKVPHQPIPSPLLNRYADSLVHHMRTTLPDTIYVIRKQKIIFITPTTEKNIRVLKETIERVQKRLIRSGTFKELITYTSISDSVDVYQLSKGYRQAFDTQKIMQVTYEPSQIFSYQDLGIYQIFVETDNVAQLERFIPETIRKLQEESPELLETLHAFLNANQNYSEAAQALFVHPKTIRYRVNRLRETYGINFADSEEMLHVHIGIRILKLFLNQQASSEGDVING